MTGNLRLCGWVGKEVSVVPRHKTKPPTNTNMMDAIDMMTGRLRIRILT
jgi:hypothetical protein